MTSIVSNVYIDGQRVPRVTRDPAIPASVKCAHTGGNPATAATDGTDTTPAVTETYLAEIYIEETSVVTGIAVLNGSAVAGNVTHVLFDANGYLLAKTASTAQAGTAGYQKVDLSAPLTLPGGTYFVAATFDSTSARFRSHIVGVFGAGKLTAQTYGTLNKITVPSTFTTGQGPIASLY